MKKEDLYVQGGIMDMEKEDLLNKFVFETSKKCIKNAHSILNRNLADANDIARAYLREIKDVGINTKESLLKALGEENFLDLKEELEREELKNTVYCVYNDISEYLFDLYCNENISFNFKEPRNITELVNAVEEIAEIDDFIVQDLRTDYISEVKILLSEDKIDIDSNSKKFIMEAAELFSPVFDSYMNPFSEKEFLKKLEKISI